MARLILFNKPFQVLCQFSDKEGRSTLADYITTPGVYPAGRLDYDSEGLLLLTSDGQLQHRIAHPSQKLPKTYWVQVEGMADQQALQQLRTGVELKDGITKPAKVDIIPPPNIWPRTPPVRYRANIADCWLQITLTEGRNRQVRRMTAAVGLPTLRLVRASIGHWTLDDLAPGQSKTLEVHLPKTSGRSATARPQQNRRRS
ncbi:pseudouridine synthase [Simiduia agarivorans]|uniref:Pseudouridine synthase n=1 Tax=Simiduia agarivorans (strain DSM 21679 / JCM 13881 / BCRC 17597 / SA1) TaxID=1117647 RepID=K4KI15_SIMAS|nr:pseudouridine synthase [Simiduia agarivorans]AFU97840.1 Ribosomal large subunit pseudouridine synthase E, rRNA-uridine isomerase E [Simiduia agarivorans SA1 = DSM 21679]